MGVPNMGIFSSNYNIPAITGEKRTNADRIRGMSDEELAGFLANFQMATFDLVFSELCKQFQIDKSKMPNVVDCAKDKLKTEKLSWLRATVEEAQDG